MNVKQLRAFYLAATHGTLTSAAAKLKLSLPAVSSQIRKLEDELKISLFDHHANRLILTTQGASFLGRVGEILHALDRAIETAAKKPSRRSEKYPSLWGLVLYGSFLLQSRPSLKSIPG